MRPWVVGALALALSACGGGESYDPHSDNHGYGYHYDTVTALGVRYRSDLDESMFTPHPDVVDAALSDAAACLGVDIDEAAIDVMLVLVPDLDNGRAGTESRGVHHHAPPLIVVDYSDWIFPMFLMMEHEFVHYLLLKHTGDADGGHENGCYPANTVLH